MPDEIQLGGMHELDIRIDRGKGTVRLDGKDMDCTAFEIIGNAGRCTVAKLTLMVGKCTFSAMCQEHIVLEQHKLTSSPESAEQ